MFLAKNCQKMKNESWIILLCEFNVDHIIGQSIQQDLIFIRSQMNDTIFDIKCNHTAVWFSKLLQYTSVDNVYNKNELQFE